VERGAVEDDVRPNVGEGAVDGGAVGDVELGARERAGVVAQQRGEVGGQLAPRRR